MSGKIDKTRFWKVLISHRGISWYIKCFIALFTSHIIGEKCHRGTKVHYIKWRHKSTFSQVMLFPWYIKNGLRQDNCLKDISTMTWCSPWFNAIQLEGQFTAFTHTCLVLGCLQGKEECRPEQPVTKCLWKSLLAPSKTSYPHIYIKEIDDPTYSDS